MKKAFVIDTNVLVVADGRSDHSRSCAAACAKVLGTIISEGKVLIDDRNRILAEYRANVSQNRQPGVGLEFFRWLSQNVASIDHCEQLRLKDADPPRMFDEFPDIYELVEFDLSDKKFIAVAMKHGNCHAILQAVDSKWFHFREAIAMVGLNLTFLCPEIEAVARRKFQ